MGSDEFFKDMVTQQSVRKVNYDHLYKLGEPKMMRDNSAMIRDNSAPNLGPARRTRPKGMSNRIENLYRDGNERKLRLDKLRKEAEIEKEREFVAMQRDHRGHRRAKPETFQRLYDDATFFSQRRKQKEEEEEASVYNSFLGQRGQVNQEAFARLYEDSEIRKFKINSQRDRDEQDEAEKLEAASVHRNAAGD